MSISRHGVELLPVDLDLGAITVAIERAGFKLRDAQISAVIRTWTFASTDTTRGSDQPDLLEEIHIPSPQFGISDDPNGASRLLAVQALTRIIDITGDPHLWCGPRDARERAYVDLINEANLAACTA